MGPLPKQGEHLNRVPTLTREGWRRARAGSREITNLVRRRQGSCAEPRLGSYARRFEVPDAGQPQRHRLRHRGMAHCPLEVMPTCAFGDRLSWKLHTLRVGLELVGLDPALTRHGIAREVFVAPRVSDCRAVLPAERSRRLFRYLRERRAIPRASRMAAYTGFGVDALPLLRVPERLRLEPVF
jgi:hypothetical protein